MKLSQRWYRRPHWLNEVETRAALLWPLPRLLPLLPGRHTPKHQYQERFPPGQQRRRKRRAFIQGLR